MPILASELLCGGGAVLRENRAVSGTGYDAIRAAIAIAQLAAGNLRGLGILATKRYRERAGLMAAVRGDLIT